VSADQTTEAEVRELIASVIAAAEGLSPWELPQSVLGRIRRARPPERSEYRLFASRDVRRTARYLTNILIPSSQRRGPEWLPAPLREVFFHQTTTFRRPDPEGSYDAFGDEAWFFINGILTDAGMAGWNAEYLARLFHRPFTVIQNATDGPVADLLECAAEKAFGMNGEAADVAFPEIYRALKDNSKDRVVIIAHSQGTLISSVILRLLRLVYERSGDLMSNRHRDDELAELRRTGVTLDPDDFEDVTTEELRRLEIYCFANCATEMRYVDPELELPWIESLGNEHDLVARLGMLAPRRRAEDVAIDGALWVRPGGWGHLLNHHYLRDIDRAQGGGSGPGPATATAAPYERYGAGHDQAAAPRLFGYLYGGLTAPR
jgi:hypothetical protein